jgi:hypothetical protein
MLNFAELYARRNQIVRDAGEHLGAKHSQCGRCNGLSDGFLATGSIVLNSIEADPAISGNLAGRNTIRELSSKKHARVANGPLPALFRAVRSGSSSAAFITELGGAVQVNTTVL